MITRIGDVYIPPRKKRVVGKQCITIPFVITGAIPSKKNNQIPVVDRRQARDRLIQLLREGDGFRLEEARVQEVIKAVHARIRPSNKFRAWHEKWKPKLIEQAARWTTSYASQKLIFPVTRASISIYHYWANNVARDNSNKAESIHDLLIDAGILTGDTWQVLHATRSEADLYAGEITDHITVINLTAYQW